MVGWACRAGQFPFSGRSTIATTVRLPLPSKRSEAFAPILFGRRGMVQGGERHVGSSVGKVVGVTSVGLDKGEPFAVPRKERHAFGDGLVPLKPRAEYKYRVRARFSVESVQA